MKNFIAAGLLAIIAIAGTSVYMHNNQQATNDVNLMLYYKPGGTYDRLNKTVIAPAIGDRFNKTVAIKGCASLKAYWDKTDASNMPQFWRMGKMSNSLFANKGLNPMLVFKNMTVEEAQQLYRQVLDSDEYKNVIEKQYRRHELADSDVSTQLDFLKTYQQHLVNVMR
jgi:hypothetical protein